MSEAVHQPLSTQLEPGTTLESSMDDTNLGRQIRAAFYGLAVCDALGGPLEFKLRRPDPSTYVRDMLPNPNFNLPAGHFTDDTSMALCLAVSLSAHNGQHDSADQARRYVMWLDEGYMSSVPGDAFDVGIQTRQALRYWREKSSVEAQHFVSEKLNEARRCGNGSLMRVLPCALMARSEEEAAALARQSSTVTHPHARCVDACAIYSVLTFHALRKASKEELVQILQREANVVSIDADLSQRLKPYNDLTAFLSKPRKAISSSGYVLDSLEAALWAFFRTDTFEEGAIEVVNLGNDADTVGAIYGGLAGAFYGEVNHIPERWLEEMKKVDLIEDVVVGILQVRTQRKQQDIR